MNGSNYLGFEEDDTEMGPTYEFPAIYRCASTVCFNYNNEFLVQTEEAKICTDCKLKGAWVRRFVGHKPERYICGMCKCVMVISATEWPVGHHGWGFLKLSNTHQFKYLCVKCANRLKLDFPALAQVDTIVKIEVLPKIVRPSRHE